MTRWANASIDPTLTATWQAVRQAVQDAKVDDPTITSAVEELARLKKVVAYVETLVQSIDPELAPISIWTSFNEHATNLLTQVQNYTANRNVAHLAAANSHADSLLTFAKPYLVAAGRTARALREAAVSYSQSMTDQLVEFQRSVTESLQQVSRSLTALKEHQETASEYADEIQRVREELMGGDGTSGSLGEVRAAIKGFEEKNEQIIEFYTETIAGTSSADSTKDEIAEALAEIRSSRAQIELLLQKTATAVSDLGTFHTKIFGAPNEAGARTGGLASEVDRQVKRLDDFGNDQKIRYGALNAQIESLLPGATNVGLASAYREMKDSFAQPIRNADKMFFVAITVLVVASLLLTVESVSLAGIRFAKVDGWEAVSRGLLNKLPFYLPVVWFAYFATKRRSEFHRLQQEYAHKESLAKSFDSYKRQIEELGTESDELLAALLRKAIEAIAMNPSATLDGKHGDKMPAHEIVEKAVEAALSAKRAAEKAATAG